MGGTLLHSFSSNVPIVTFLVPYLTSSPMPFCQVKLCTIHSLSSLSLKSSLACAPLLSVLVSAALLVWLAFVNRFRNSSVSTRSLFQIRLLSVMRRSRLKDDSKSPRLALPEARESCVRNTAVVFCMVVCMSKRRDEVGVEPAESRKVVTSLMESRPMLFSEGLWDAPGVWLSAM